MEMGTALRTRVVLEETMNHPCARAASLLALFLPLGACGDKGDDRLGDTGFYGAEEDVGDVTQEDEIDTAEPEEEDCEDETPVTLYMSPDDSNSMSSPVQVRGAVEASPQHLRSVPVRTFEFMNYYRWDYEPADDIGDLALHAAMVPDPDGTEGQYALQFALSSAELSAQERPPLNLALSLDTSGSMSGTSISLLRTSALQIASQLREGDTVSVVFWDTSNNVLLQGHAVTGPSDPVLVDLLSGIDADGGTDLNGGLVAGYDLAAESAAAGITSRVVLISDGGANAGVTEEELIARMAGDGDEEGIYLVGVGVGSAATYNDRLMDIVTDQGKGAAVFLDEADEVERVFGTDFVNTFEVAARNVKVQVDMPPGFEIVRTTAEKVSADPEAVQDQHLAPNDAMVFHQDILTCAPEDIDGDSEITITATWQHPTTFEGRTLSRTYRFDELFAADTGELWKGRAVSLSAEALIAYKQEQFEGGEDAGPAREAAHDAVEAALELDPTDADLAELGAILAGL